MAKKYLKSKSEEKPWCVDKVVFSDKFVEFDIIRRDGKIEHCTILASDFQSLRESE